MQLCTQFTYLNLNDCRSRFRPNARVSWVFMKGNLERLLKCLRGYYTLHLGLVLDPQRMPDLVRLARQGEINIQN